MEKLLISLIRPNSVFSKFAEKLVPSNYLYQKSTWRIVKIKGINLNLDISDYVNHWIYFGLEDKGYDELLKLSVGQSLILDVGANIGFTALSMSQSNLPNGVVHAFEPDPYNFTRLENNASLNPEANLVIQNKGLGKESGRLKLVINTADNLGGNRINSHAEDNFTLVDITTIDEYCKAHSIGSVDLIKIDVEGFEYNVLKGAHNLIATSKPTLFIELDDNNLIQQGATASELVSYLEAHYNNIYSADTSLPITSSDDFSNCHLDIVAKNEN